MGTLRFEFQSVCPKVGASISSYDVEIYDNSNVLIGSFNTASEGVAFNVVNETAFDIAAAFSGTFPEDITFDKNLFPAGNVRLTATATDECGESATHNQTLCTADDGECLIHTNLKSLCPVIGNSVRTLYLYSLGTVAGEANAGVPAAGSQLLFAFLNRDEQYSPAVSFAWNSIDLYGLTPLFSGVWDEYIKVNKDGLPFDVELAFEVTDSCGSTVTQRKQIFAPCQQPTASVSVQRVGTTIEFDITFGLLLEADIITLSLTGDNINASGVFVDGASYTSGATSNTQWNDTGTPSVGDHITGGASNVDMSALFSGGQTIRLNKRSLAQAFGLITDESTDNTELEISISAQLLDCDEDAQIAVATIEELTEPDILVPFVGKQSANPKPEIMQDGTAGLCGSTWAGLSIRNGSPLSKIDRIEIDINNGNVTKTYSTTLGTAIFPVPALTDADGAALSCGNLSANPSPYFGIDLTADLQSEVLGSPPGGSEAPCEYEVKALYDQGGLNLETTISGFINYGTSYDAVEAEWLFGDAEILLARGDALVYGTQTTLTGLQVEFNFSVNDSQLNDYPGVTSWTVQEIRVADQPGASPVDYTTYNNVLDDAFHTAPAAGRNQTIVTQQHTFPSVGAYKVFLEVTADGTITGSGNDITTLVETWVLIVKY